MKHAYLIIAHSDVAHLQLLIDALDDIRNDIYIHVDKKIDIREFSYLKVKKAEIFFTKERIDVRWGTPSLIEAEYSLFRCAYNPNIYSRYHLISGADFPLKSQDYIHQFFSKYRFEEFIHISGSENHGKESAWELYKKCRIYHFWGSSIKHTNKLKAKIANNLRRSIMAIQIIIKIRRKYSFNTLYKGSEWGSFTSNFIKALLDQEEIVKTEFKHTHCSDEVYKQTIAIQGNFSISDYGNMRYIDFSRGNGMNPYIFTPDDLEELKYRPELFARKFSTSVSRDLCEQLKASF